MRCIWIFILLFLCQTVTAQITLIPWKMIEASGAREITPFLIEGQRYLAVSQLAKDIPHTAPNMNGGDSDVDLIIMRESKGTFARYQNIPSHGNEGSSFFSINGSHFLAVASIRSGPHAPYNLETYSKLYRWDGDKFYPVQQFFSLATKQWHHFKIGTRHFLAQANGISQDGFKSNLSTNSVIYEWKDDHFESFQIIPSRWAYSWTTFEHNNQFYLVLADHLDRSTMYRWNGKSFQPFQSFEGSGARAFHYMKFGNKALLAYANITKDSLIYEWKNNQWVLMQTLKGKGGRNFLSFSNKGQNYLLRINFIEGNRTQPRTALKSPIYEWNGQEFKVVSYLDTFGGVSANLFEHAGKQFIAVANSLSEKVRFKQSSVIYKVQ